MKLSTLIKKHKIKLNTNTRELCIKGLNVMKGSIDPVHDKRHIETIFSNLSLLLTKAPEIKPFISFDVLLPAICWHDAWKSKRLAKNPFQYVWHQIIEGLGSSHIFYRQACIHGIQKEVAKRAAFVIRKHSLLQIVPSRKIEVKILLDLDGLELWNFRRLEIVNKQLFGRKKIYKTLTKAFYSILNKRKLNFDVLNGVLKDHKTKYLTSLDSLKFGKASSLS